MEQRHTYHRFLDEAGDTTFFGSGRKVIIGEPGVSRAFYLGSVKFNCPLSAARLLIGDAARRVVSDAKLSAFPSVRKRIAAGGFFFHAKDDPKPVRDLFFDEIRDLSCKFEIIAARKSAARFRSAHQSNEDAFYADILGHLLKGKLRLNCRLVLNIAQRGSSTRAVVLERALAKAKLRAEKKWSAQEFDTEIVFNVQDPRRESLLAVADYFGWAVQRVFERGDTEAYDRVSHRIRSIHDIYDIASYDGNKNWYTPTRPLTKDKKIGPPAP